MTSDRVPAAPAGVGAAGKRLWRSVVSGYVLAEHETALLREACHVADTCAELQQRVALDGAVIVGKAGPVAHPALVELRQQRVLLSRLIVSLRVPLGDQEDDEAKHSGAPRLQHRGTRGAYGPRALRSAG